MEMATLELLLGHPGLMIDAYRHSDEHLRTGIAAIARKYFDLLEKEMSGTSS